MFCLGSSRVRRSPPRGAHPAPFWRMPPPRDGRREPHRLADTSSKPCTERCLRLAYRRAARTGEVAGTIEAAPGLAGSAPSWAPLAPLLGSDGSGRHREQHHHSRLQDHARLQGPLERNGSACFSDDVPSPGTKTPRFVRARDRSAGYEEGRSGGARTRPQLLNNATRASSPSPPRERQAGSARADDASA